ncbi:unnamed protein product [Periconia digitata]|uniref:Protein kinase domain-containing protein n=1 Tax=Periconia digitata TaxID=1303443 RepID=A0A9W4XRC2_9PLEO|nr:unnamed protein product [Periconia digitata]
MADAAGLAFAVFDKLWLVGSKTAEAISDYREFDKDSIKLANDLITEINRTKTLECLLFEPSKAYDGKSLFTQFDENVQIQIHVQLRKLLNIINEGAELLECQKIDQHSALPPEKDRLPTRFSKSPLLSSDTTLSKKPSRTLRLRWSLWDKKRLEMIIRKFVQENEKVSGQVQLMCHATSVGVTLTHLDRLKTNEHSKKLGFDLPAHLHIETTGMNASPISLQLNDETLFRKLATHSKETSGFTIIAHDNRDLLAEFRSYAPDKIEATALETRTKDRIELLARLLCQKKDTVFHTLSCLGWVLDAQNNRVAFIFSIPENAQPKPTSLLDAYRLKDYRPTLGERFRLAHSLSRALSELQLVQWVHKSFRSENILLFPNPEPRLEVSQPWVMGFEFSRPEFDFSSGRADDDVARNVYRHPERQKQPQKPFTKIHDIYSLGVVLLEIGLWRPVLTLTTDGFKRVKDAWTVQEYLVKKAERSLPREVGEHYKQCVSRCLAGRFDVLGGEKEDLGLQQAFREQVVDVLEGAAQSIG